MPQNNRATTFTHVRGKGQVLLIEDQDSRGEFDLLVERLRGQNLEVTVQPTDRLFAGLAELQPFDTVLLANVPARDASATTRSRCSCATRSRWAPDWSCSAAPNSFGAGGWTNTKLEKAMPVDFQIKNAKVLPRGALVHDDARQRDAPRATTGRR